MARKIYYKVVKNSHQSLFAYCPTTYNLNKWTKPSIPGSKLAVFTSLDTALEARNTHKCDIVYKCYVKNPIKAYAAREYIDVYPTRYWAVVNKARAKRKNISNALLKAGYSMEWAKDTVLCDKVMLIEKI